MQIDAYSCLIMLADSSFFTADDTGKIPEMINYQWQIGRPCFTNGFSIINCFYSGQVLKVVFNALGNF